MQGSAAGLHYEKATSDNLTPSFFLTDKRLLFSRRSSLRNILQVVIAHVLASPMKPDFTPVQSLHPILGNLATLKHRRGVT